MVLGTLQKPKQLSTVLNKLTVKPPVGFFNRKEESSMYYPGGYYGYGYGSGYGYGGYGYGGGSLRRLLLFLLVIPVIFWFVGAF